MRDHAEEVTVWQALAQVGGDDLDAERLGAGGQHRGGLAVHVGVDGQPVRRAAYRAVHQRHRLGGGGALVEHRGIGDLEPGQVGDHRLKVQQRLETALADLGLVRRVGGVPGRVFKDVAAQHRWRQRVEVALTDHRYGDGVGVGQARSSANASVSDGGRGQHIEAGRDAVGGQRVEDACGQCLVGELVERTHADGLEHGGDGVGIRSDVAVGEIRLVMIEHVHISRRVRAEPLGSSPSVVDPLRAPERFGHSPTTREAPFPMGG